MRKWLGCLLVLCGLAFVPSAHAQFISTNTPIFISEQLVGTTGNILIVDSPTLVVDATNHRVGVGTAAPTTPLHIVDARSDIAGTAVTLTSASTLTLTSNNANIWNGINHTSTVDQGAFNGTSGSGTARGMVINTNASGTSGTVSLLVGMQASANNVGAGTLSLGLGVWALGPTNSGGGTYTEYDNFYASAGTAAGIIRAFRGLQSANATRWNLYMDGTAQNSLAGKLGIGFVTAPGALLDLADTATTGTVIPAFQITNAAHTALTASTERFDTNFNGARTVQWATGALTTQRFNVFQAPTIGFVGASTVTDTATVAITGAPVKGTNATLTQTHGLLIQAGATSTAAAAYGLTVNTPTGATLNYAAQFLGGPILVADGSVSAPSIVFITQPDLGFFKIAQRIVGLKGTSGGNTGLVVPSDNSNGIHLGSDGVVAGGSAVVGFTASTSGTSLDTADAMFSRVGAGSIRMGGAASATPVAQTLSVQNATGSTITAAATWTHIGPLGTGLADTGTTLFQVALSKQAVAATLHTASTVLTLGNTQAAHPGTAGAVIDSPALTWNDEKTANSGTAATAYMRNFGQPTLTARGTSVTTTNAANLTVAGPPIASTNMTTTNVHGLLITAGSAVGATVGYGLTATAPTGATTNYAANFAGEVLLGSVIFTGLGTPANGTITYCSDCDPPTLVDQTCTHAGAQTGSLAVRTNGAWKCIS